MLLTCLSCNSKYLVNSADLKPNGRTVQCAKCRNEWFQELNLIDEDLSISSTFHTVAKKQRKNKEELHPVSNLPSTYVKEQKPSFINSFLIVLFFVILIYLFLIIKKVGIGIIALLYYYIQEFYFNLKLIINDLATIIHQIIN